MIAFADDTARAICPFCAGKTSDIQVFDWVILSVADEVEGWHDVETNQGPQKFPCLATPLHQLSRNLFEEMMKQREAA